VFTRDGGELSSFSCGSVVFQVSVGADTWTHNHIHDVSIFS